VEEVGNILLPIREKIIGNLLGNHFWEDVRGVNSEQHLAKFLDIPYLGPFGIIRVDFIKKSGAGKTQVLDSISIVAHHSSPSKSASTPGSEVNRLVKFGKDWDANICCLGHTHRALPVENAPVWGISGRGRPDPFLKPKLLLACGTLMDGVHLEDSIPVNNPHFPHYAESAGFSPTVAGWPVATIRCSREGQHKDKVAERFVKSITGAVVR